MGRTIKENAELTVNEVLTRRLLNHYLGSSFNGNRDLYEALGYFKDGELTYGHYSSRYYRGDIAGRVIDAPCNGSWRNVPDIYEEVQEETQFEIDWKKIAKRLQVFRNLNMLDKFTGLGRFGALYLGFDGDVANAPRQGAKLLYIRALGEGSITIGALETNKESVRFGMPKTYSINAADGKIGLSNIHFSRIIHVTDGLSESPLYGIPRMQNVYNRLCDLEKVSGGSAEMYWRGARPGYQAELDPESMLTPEAKEGMKQQLDEYENKLRRVLTTQGVKMNALAPQVSNPTEFVDVQLTLISAATNIPKRILSGSERGELSSNQDQVAWNNVIQDRRVDFCEPCILRPFIDRLIEFGILTTPKDGEYTIEWKDLFVIGDKDKADISKSKADAIAQYANGIGAQEICPPEVFLEEVMGFSKLTMQRIKEIVGNLEPTENPDLQNDISTTDSQTV